MTSVRGPHAHEPLERRGLLAASPSTTASRSSASIDFDIRLRVAADSASGCRNGDRRRERRAGRARAPRTRRPRSGPTSAASDASSSARSIACSRGGGRLVAEAEVDDHRPVGGDEDVGGAQRAVGDAGAVQRCDLAATPRRAASSSISSGVERRRGGRPSTCSIASTIEPSGSAATRRDRGHAHAASPGQQQQQRLVLDVALERRSTASRRSGRAAPACGSRGRAGRRRGCRWPYTLTNACRRRSSSPVQLGPAALGPLAASRSRDRRARPRASAAATAAGAGRRFGAPNDDEHARRRPRRRRRRRGAARARPALPAIAMHERRARATRRRRRGATAGDSHGLPTVATAAAPAR